MESVLEKLSEKQIHHPIVIVLGCREDISQVFVVAEGIAVHVNLGIVSAVDRMIKLHFMLNMEYAVECRHILHFLQRTVFGIDDNLPLSRCANDISLFIRHKMKKN